MTGRDPVESGYERRIRLASEVATWGIAGILVGSAALPTTDPIARVGLLGSAGLLAVFALLWFHVIPGHIFGRMRFTIGTAITQIVGSILLVLTGGGSSNYFVFFLFPVLATTFAMRLRSTLVVGAVALVAYVTILVTDGILHAGAGDTLEQGAVRLSALVALVAMTALISRTMQDTRRALRQRSDELASQNQELEISHATAVAIARSRDLAELSRAVAESARAALKVPRLFFFGGAEATEHGWTVGPDGSMEPFDPDPRMRDSPRQRAMRARRTVVVNDMADEPMVGDRVRTKLHVAAGLFVPLLHRGEPLGLLVFGDAAPRKWTAREVRLAEIIAESVAPPVASYLALETVREEREELAGRLKVL